VRAARPHLWEEDQKKYQNQRCQQWSRRGKGLADSGRAELTFLADSAAGRGAMYVRSRDDTQEQEAEEAQKGDRASPRGTMSRSLHTIGAQA
jgi:hypothetical protein